MSDTPADTSEDPGELREQAKAAGIDVGPEPVNDKPQRPENVEEKFWDAEKGEVNLDALLNSYSELQKKLSSNDTKEGGDPESPSTAEEGDEDGQETDNEGDESDAEKAGREAVENAGLDYDAMSKEFSENGELSEDTYKALADAGIPESVVNTYLAGFSALMAQNNAQVFEAAGGEENYQAMVEWARDASEVTNEEAQAFDEAINSGNLNTARMAVAGLRAKYEASNGSEPGRTINGGNGNQGGDVFRSAAEVEEAMSDPRYRNDPAYRDRVIQKLGRSDVF